MNDYSLKLVTEPKQEPLTVPEVVANCSLPDPDTPEIDRLTRLIVTAREVAEVETGRLLIEQTWDLLLLGFPSWAVGAIHSAAEIRIPRAPLKQTGGIVSVKYLDTNGAQQTLAVNTDYEAVLRSEPGVVLPSYGKSWPSTYSMVKAGKYPVEIQFIGGYGTNAASVPAKIRQGMLLCIAQWNEFRGDEERPSGLDIPEAARALFWQSKFFPR